MDFVRREYRIKYAPNTRETVRRQVLHQFVLAGIADYNPFDRDLPTNSPRVSLCRFRVRSSRNQPIWNPRVGGGGTKFLQEPSAVDGDFS
jgi:BsuBI/PstI restriction endonuclease HTH domain